MRSLAQPAVEFGPRPLPIVAGVLPTQLRGTLYRNGPGRLERGGHRVPHWFDGDGGILAVNFDGQGATGLYRYVQTAGFQAETVADRYLFSGYGQLAPGPFWKRWGSQPKNVANTSVLALPDQLLALWEGGIPYSLDRGTLATKGVAALGLRPADTFSAHPKRDPQTGDLYNFGVQYGPTSALHLFRCDRNGQVQQRGKIPLERVALVHDFGLAGPYLVFLVPPVILNVLPIVTGTQSFSDALQWRPQYGTQIIVVDRETLTEMTRFTTDPWFQWHVGNGYQDQDGHLVIDYVRFANFDTNRWLQEVATGHPQTPAPGYLWQLRLDVEARKVIANTQRYDQECEFPIVADHEVGQPASALYLSSMAAAKQNVAETFDSLVRIEAGTGRVTQVTFGTGYYPSEPIVATDPQQPEHGWMMTVVYDAQKHQSTVQIFAAQQLDAGPLCVLALPDVIPAGFHGTWQAGP